MTTAKKLLALAVFALLGLTGCDPDIDVAFQTGNALNTTHHDVNIALSGPGLVKNYGPYRFGEYQTFVEKFDATHEKQTDVDVLFTFTDMATGAVATKVYRMSVYKTTNAMATDGHFKR